MAIIPMLVAVCAIVYYAEVKDLPNHPEKYLIDLRPPEGFEMYDFIPTSINIPSSDLEGALQSTDEEFLKKYGREKPEKDSYIIFTCITGEPARKACYLAASMGYINSKVYYGAYVDWEFNEGLNRTL